MFDQQGLKPMLKSKIYFSYLFPFFADRSNNYIRYNIMEDRENGLHTKTRW